MRFAPTATEECTSSTAKKTSRFYKKRQHNKIIYKEEKQLLEELRQASGERFQRLLNLIRDSLLNSRIVHCDEARVQTLKEPDREASSQSWMWPSMSSRGIIVRCRNSTTIASSKALGAARVGRLHLSVLRSGS
nr:IS66 family transposase [Pseudomonas sp. LRP2-20]